MTAAVLPRGVIGTAGHIDHGKTALVRVLTGIDTDRLKEEKARGITIELGFAHLALPSGRSVGVVDVPGHERYLRTMVAGAVGFDLVLLVVAADEGVMPQTREHLDVCELLGVERGIVVLTKTDLVADEEMLELVEADVRALLSRTPFADAPIVRCSARNGDGIAALRDRIDATLRAPALRSGREEGAALRIPIDRVFTMKGFGSVVTGTLWSGRISIDDEVSLVPERGLGVGKVRGLQSHGEQLEVACAGQRVAVNVGWPKDTIGRGQVLGHAGFLTASRVFDARVRLLVNARRPLRRRTRVLLHAGTMQAEATVRLLGAEQLAPGDTSWAEIESDEPLVLLPGDRFVLRGFQPQKDHGTTLGGGEVVRVLGSRSRRGARTEPTLLDENLVALRDGDLTRRVELEVERAGMHGIVRTELMRRLPFSRSALDEALERASTARRIVRFDREHGAYVAEGALRTLGELALSAIAEHHRAHPLEAGMPRESLRSSVTSDPRLMHRVLEALQQAGSVRVEREHVRLVGHAADRIASDRGLDTLGEQLLRSLAAAGVQPPRPQDLDPSPSAMAALDALVKQRRVVRMKELYFASEAIDVLRRRLIEYLEQHGAIDAQGWKALTGASRKYSIPLAEYFDAEKVTLRVGDLRKLRR